MYVDYSVYHRGGFGAPLVGDRQVPRFWKEAEQGKSDTVGIVRYTYQGQAFADAVRKMPTVMKQLMQFWVSFLCIAKQRDAKDILDVIGNVVDDGFGRKMNGQVIVYLDTLVDVTSMPRNSERLIHGVLSKCAIFTSKGR